MTVAGCSRLMAWPVLSLDNPEPSQQGRRAGRQISPVGRAMDLPADRSRPTSAPPLHPSLPEAVRSPRRRRPTGAAPPLPYRLQTSGIRWLVAAVILIGLTLAIFARGLRGSAVAVTVVDDAVVQWLAGLVGPGLVAPLRGLARIGSWWMLYALYFGLVLVLLVLRRWRHLIIWWVVVQLGGFLTFVLTMVGRRPRPFGVELRSSWGGWAMPSVQVAYLTAILIGVLYTLVPEGRWRNLGKWVVAGLITLVALARITLGVDAPTDVLVGVGIGVALPLLLFRRFTPNEAYPVAYRRGRSAHLDIGGARGVAIRRALEDQLGLIVEEVKPFGLAGSAGSTPLRIKVKGDPPTILFGKLYAQSHLRSDAGTSWAGSCCMAGWRTRSRSTPSAGWSSRRTTPCTSCTPPGCPAQPRSGSSSSPRSGSICWSPSSSRAPPSWARPRSTRASSTTAWASSAS